MSNLRSHNKAHQRQSSRHEGYFKARAINLVTEKNKKKKMVRTMKKQPNNRLLALRMKHMFGTEFDKSLTGDLVGPYTITKLGAAYYVPAGK